jgi:hypothetical protein
VRLRISLLYKLLIWFSISYLRGTNFARRDFCEAAAMENLNPPPVPARRKAAESSRDTDPSDAPLADAADARALVEAELQGVRERVGVALAQAQYGALVGAAAVAFSVLALGAVTTALLLAIGVSPVPALVLAALVLFTGAAVAGYAYLVLPSSRVESPRKLAKVGFGELRRLLKSHLPSMQRG